MKPEIWLQVVVGEIAQVLQQEKFERGLGTETQLQRQSSQSVIQTLTSDGVSIYFILYLKGCGTVLKESPSAAALKTLLIVATKVESVPRKVERSL